jgi:RNA-directed DNA polymerase
MGTRRQKIQGKLAFTVEGRDEAPTLTDEGTEVSMAKRTPERPDHLMEEVCERGNLTKALKRVKANKGSPGIDGMTVDELPHYLKEHWTKIEAQLLAGTYRPKPVRRVEIPKPEGGMRSLGIPTVVDRFIQQAVLQVLQKRWDETFSDHSYGFRPGRSAHQAVTQAQTYITEGYGYVVDIDLEKFFDRVNHDMLMGRIAKRIADKRVLALIRAFLHAGVMEDGLTTPTDEGTPQGGPLSPLLSNLFLDDLDRELERRGHRFVRYADDCNIYVRTERAGHRVMESISRFITKKLKLRVNGEKSAVARPSERTFLGFSVTGGKRPRRRIAPKALKRRWSSSCPDTLSDGPPTTASVKPRQYLPASTRGSDVGCAAPSGSSGSGGVHDSPSFEGESRNLAAQTAGTAHGPWRISRSPALSFALPDAYFTSLGLPALVTRQMT